MAIDSGYFENFNTDNISDMDDVAALLVKLYADCVSMAGGVHKDNYATAVGIAIRMLQG